MLHLLIPFVALTLSIFVAAKLLDGMKIEGGFGSHLVVSLVFGLVSFFAGWCVFFLIGVMTAGLGFLFAFITRWIVAAIMLALTAKLTDRLKLKSFGTALLASLIMSVVGTATEYALHVLL